MEGASSSNVQDDVVVISDSDDGSSVGDPPSKRTRGRRRAAVKEAPKEKPQAPSRGRKRAAAAKAVAVPSADDTSRAAKEVQKRKPSTRGRKPAAKAVAELPTGWGTVPENLLIKVFHLLGNLDVVSAGQTCQLWRAAAKLPLVWRRRGLAYDLGDADTKKFKDWHAGAKAFSITIRFAPCLGRVSCAKSLKAAAKKAISTQSKCEVRSAELNGQLKWTEKYISRQEESLEDLTLLNPTVDILKTALALTQLKSLSVSYERDTTKEKYMQIANMYGGKVPLYKVPDVPRGTTGSLKKLICHPGVRPSAVEALVLANAATLEEVGAHSFPLNALQRCAKLRRLLILVAPDKDADKLRQLLQGRAPPLEYLAFIGTANHKKGPCVSLRSSLHDRVGRAIVCSACHGVCVQERPQFASRDVPVPEEQFDEFDFLGNMFRGSGHCMCICCANAEGEFGGDEYYDSDDGDYGGYDDYY